MKIAGVIFGAVVAVLGAIAESQFFMGAGIGFGTAGVVYSWLLANKK